MVFVNNASTDCQAITHRISYLQDRKNGGKDMSRKNMLILLSLIAWLLTACSSSQAPRLIGSYPSLPPREEPPLHPVTQQVEMELRVVNAEGAAEQAIRNANYYRGYLESSRSWHQSGVKCISLELVVPTPYYESLRTDLRGLGILISERKSGPIIAGYSNAPSVAYSQITLLLRQEYSILPTIKTFNGRIFQTLQNAFAFSVSMIGFLANLLIWFFVVISPFALVGWLIYRAIQKRTK
jgi:hypothetical protein